MFITAIVGHAARYRNLFRQYCACDSSGESSELYHLNVILVADADVIDSVSAMFGDFASCSVQYIVLVNR